MKNTDTKEKILEYFFDYPNKAAHLRELARILKISPVPISKASDKLEREGLLTKEKKFLYSIRANLDNERFKQLKRVENLKKIYTSGIFNILKDKFPLSAIVLFGSYSKGEDSEKSDIDIAIINAKETKIDLEKYEEMLKRKINIEFINLKSISKELRNSILNGIVLSGYVET